MTKKNNFYDGCSWVKFNSLVLALDIALKFYICVAKELKRKVRNFWMLTTEFVEVTGGPFCPPPHSELGEGSLLIISRKIKYFAKVLRNLMFYIWVVIFCVICWKSIFFKIYLILLKYFEISWNFNNLHLHKNTNDCFFRFQDTCVYVKTTASTCIEN